MAYINHCGVYIIVCLSLTLVQLIWSFECDNTSHGNDVAFDKKVSESPIVVLGTSLNKNMDRNIRNLFNVTFLVHCILKGRPTSRVISIVQAGSLLGRRTCQRLDANRQYIVFLEAFFDGTYRPVDFQETPYTTQVQSLLDKTCGLSRTYPFTEVNNTSGHLTDRCPPAVSIDCPIETTKEPTMLPTNDPALRMESKAGSTAATTLGTTRLNLLGKNPMDLEVLSLLLGEHQSHNFSLDFLQDQSHKSLFSDDEARKNSANRSPCMLIGRFIHWIFFAFLYIIL